MPRRDSIKPLCYSIVNKLTIEAEKLPFIESNYSLELRLLITFTN